MDVKQLLTFRTVAHKLSFTRAADALKYAQSSVTAQVQALEEELGVKLFERRGKRVTLTERGKRLLAYADKILNLVEEAKVVVSMGDEPEGALSVGTLESLCAYHLPPVLNVLKERYPGVQVMFRTGVSPDIGKMLAQELDVAVLLDLPNRSDQLVTEILREERFALLAGSCHPLVGRAGVHPEDLVDETLLLTEPGCRYRLIFEQSLADHGIVLTRKMEFTGIEAIKQCTISGLGLAVLPLMSVASEVERGSLHILPWTGTEIILYTQLAWHKDKWISPAMQAFLDVTREKLRQNLRV